MKVILPALRCTLCGDWIFGTRPGRVLAEPALSRGRPAQLPAANVILQVCMLLGCDLACQRASWVDCGRAALCHRAALECSR